MAKRDTLPAMVELGNRIYVRRAQLRMSQQQLARLSEVDPTYMSDVEAGRRNVGTLILLRIAQALETTPGQLLDGLELEGR
jgi:transcriptional regulator with XRE-family HTH domain